MRLPPSAFGTPQEILRRAATTFFEHLSEMCEGILVVDHESRLVWVNDRYERYLPRLGFAGPDEAIGRLIEEVVPNTLMRQVVQTGQPILLDIIENLSGSFVVSRIPLHDDQGKIIGAVGLILFDEVELLRPLLGRVNRLRRNLEATQRELAATRRSKYTFSSFVGNSPPVTAVKHRARRAAALSTSVLLTGETGTGKELLAHAIHAASKRAHQPFVVVNVAAIPDTLLEAEFFGVAPGAYTGADRHGRDGKFKLADGGTLFLDEIGDMPLALQAKLLRVLQDQEFEPLGSNRVLKVDARVIAATSHDLQALVKDGQFRADLYYRLNVLPIHLPPLRERPSDIAALAEQLLEQIAQRHGEPPKELDPQAQQMLAAMPWPGNVRELANILEQLCTLADGIQIRRQELDLVLPPCPNEPITLPASEVAPSALPMPIPAPFAGQPLNMASLPEQVASLERQLIAQALGLCRGNKRAAASQLGISRATLYEKLARYGLDRQDA